MLKPYLLEIAMKDLKNDEYAVYLDSDINFFNSYELLESEINHSSVFLTPHNFDEKNLFRLKFGKYNAGFIAFKKNYDGR